MISFCLFCVNAHWIKEQARCFSTPQQVFSSTRNFSSLQKVFFEHLQFSQHPKLHFFQHPKGIFSTPPSASRRGWKDLIGIVVLVVVEGIVVEVVIFGGCGCGCGCLLLVLLQ